MPSLRGRCLRRVSGANTIFCHLLLFACGPSRRLGCGFLASACPSSQSPPPPVTPQPHPPHAGIGTPHKPRGKIERRCGTFQRRLVSLFAHAKVRTYDQAHRILAMAIDRQDTSVHGPTKQIPAEVLHRSQSEHRSALLPCPPASRLDLHFSLRASRRVSNDHCIEFDGRRFQIAPTSKKYVTILFQPNAKLWISEDAPSSIWPAILGHFCL